jgi:predicted TIM-barrel fold metal-dependent hydrolase
MTVADILAVMQALEIEKCIMMSSLSIQYDFVEGNAELAQVIDGHDNLYGYVYVNMHYPQQSLLEMEKYLPSPKFVGLKYNGEYSRSPVNAEENDLVFDLLENKYRKPLLMHTWGFAEHGNAMAYSLPAYALELALRRPNLPVVMGHMGGPEWMPAIHAARKADNLYLDTCTSYADCDKVAEAVKLLGAERILWGSGMTENNAYMQKSVVLDAAISARQKELILYENARRLFCL